MNIPESIVKRNCICAQPAARAFRKALDKLTGRLVDAGVLGAVEFKLIEKNKKSPPLHTSTEQHIDMSKTMNGEKYDLIFLPATAGITH